MLRPIALGLGNGLGLNLIFNTSINMAVGALVKK